jgi:hypothetical protein
VLCPLIVYTDLNSLFCKGSKRYGCRAARVCNGKHGTPERVAEDIRHGRQGKEVGRTDPYPTP